MEANYMTRKAWDALNKKVLALQNDVKPGGKMAKEIGKAASHGDLSENAEWETAILKKDMIGNEIKNIRQRLSNCTIIDEMEIVVFSQLSLFGRGKVISTNNDFIIIESDLLKK